MENSYRALMIAAGVFLGILLLSTFIYVFRSGANFSQTVESSQITQQRIAANNKFEVYNRNNNTISDIVSLINLVYDYNSKREFDELDCIELTIDIGSVKYSIPPSSPPALLKRNMVVTSGSGGVISVYDLPSKKLGDLSISFTGSNNKDKLSITHLDKTNNTTYYKYLFIVDNFEYSKNTGYVKKMKYKVKVNEAWQAEWDLEND